MFRVQITLKSVTAARGKILNRTIQNVKQYKKKHGNNNEKSCPSQRARLFPQAMSSTQPSFLHPISSLRKMIFSLAMKNILWFCLHLSTVPPCMFTQYLYVFNHALFHPTPATENKFPESGSFWRPCEEFLAQTVIKNYLYFIKTIFI